MVLLQWLEISCSCYNNNCKTELWAPLLTLFLYTWFSWHSFNTILKKKFQRSFHHSKLIWKFQTHWVKYSTQSSRFIKNTLFFILLYILSQVKVKLAHSNNKKYPLKLYIKQPKLGFVKAFMSKIPYYMSLMLENLWIVIFHSKILFSTFYTSK